MMQPSFAGLRRFLCSSAHPRRRTTVAPLAVVIAVTALWLNAAPPVTAQQTPGAPQNLSVTSRGPELVVTWEEPADKANIACYYIRWRTAAQDGEVAGAWQPRDNGRISRDRLRGHIQDLRVGVRYDIQVRSYSKSQSPNVYGAWTAASGTPLGGSTDAALSGLTLSQGTIEPTFDPDKWREGTVTYTASVPNSVSSITVTPTASDGDGATIKVMDTEVASGSASGEINLEPGQNTITIWVGAQDPRYWRYYLLEVTRALADTTLAAPTALVVSQASSDGTWPTIELTVAWTLPSEATGAILEYRQVRKPGFEWPGWENTGVTINEDKMGGTIKAELLGGERTELRLAATSDSATSSYALASVYTYTMPAKPTNVSLIPGDGQLQVSWTAPGYTGGQGATVLFYRVRWREQPAGDCCPWEESGREMLGERVDNGLTYTIDELTNDQLYEVQVVAINELGYIPNNSFWSDTANGTPAVPGQQQQGPDLQSSELATGPDAKTDRSPGVQNQEPVAAPGRVANLGVTAMGRSVTVSWLPPERGGDPAQYIVRLRHTEDRTTKFKRPGADKQSANFGKLQRGATYRVSVRAKNDQGLGRWSHTEITIPLRRSN